jgi:hypothetical protein
VARRSLAEGIDVDFQTGEQFHKSRLATRVTQLYRLALPADEVAKLAEMVTGSIGVAAGRNTAPQRYGEGQQLAADLHG